MISFLDEPTLEFRHGQAVTDPHLGLALFGPYGSDSPAHPSNLPYVVVGTTEGIEAFSRFSRVLSGPIFPDAGQDERLWPLFPGFQAAFGCSLPAAPVKQFSIDRGLLDENTREADGSQRAWQTVDLYLKEIQRLAESDERVGVVVCVVPEFVWKRCRTESFIGTAERLGKTISRKERHQRQQGQTSLFSSYEVAAYQHSVDFRRQLKARCMRYGVPLQIVRESMLACPQVGEVLDPASSHRRLSPLSDRAWNLGVALYYKAGGKPWRLNTARPGVSYVGLAFRREEPTGTSRSAACAAQMFLDTGDGIVFLGRFGPWYSPKEGTFHLSGDDAGHLLAGTLRTYRSLGGPELTEIFLHCRSGISAEEFEGFQSACPPGVKLVGVKVRQTGTSVRLYREGKYPVLRGTFWQVSDRTGYLWTSGYKTSLSTYDGSECPVPLQIDVQHGEADLTQVARDILGLTKLNYNACKIGDAEPVTVGFSDAVGEILVSNPKTEEPRPQFRFYI